MRNRNLENRLRKIEPPEVPAGLREALLRGIPGDFRSAPGRKPFFRDRLPRMALAAATAAAAVAVVLIVVFQSFPVTLARTLGPVAEGLEKTTGIHLIGAIRSRPGEPFGFVAVDSPLQEQEIWIEAGPHGPARMRMEKPDRVIAFDGATTVFLNRRTGEYAESAGGRVPRQLIDPQLWLRTLIDFAGEGARVKVRDASGGRELHATVGQKGVPVEGREPVFWEEFDRRTEIRWERGTNRLLGMQRFVRAGPRDLLVAEIRRIEYLDRVRDRVFDLEIPGGARRFEIVDAGDEFGRLGPAEVAREFWTAAKDGAWDRLRIFCPSPALIDSFKENRPVEILSIGEPFQTGAYAGWYVPYEVRFADGRTKRHDLALRNDNAWGRFVYDGGI